MGRLFRQPTDGARRTLWQRIKELALTDVAVAVRGVDEGSLERLEEVLLEADFGVATTSRLVATVERDAREGILRTRDELLGRSARRRRIGAALGTERPRVALRPPSDPRSSSSSASTAPARRRSSASWPRGCAGRASAFSSRPATPSAPAPSTSCVCGRSEPEPSSSAARTGRDPAAVAVDALEAAAANRRDVVLIDTAGRLHTSGALMDELKKIMRVIAKRCPGAPHETCWFSTRRSARTRSRRGRRLPPRYPSPG